MNPEFEAALAYGRLRYDGINFEYRPPMLFDTDCGGVIVAETIDGTRRGEHRLPRMFQMRRKELYREVDLAVTSMAFVYSGSSN